MLLLLAFHSAYWPSSPVDLFLIQADDEKSEKEEDGEDADGRDSELAGVKYEAGLWRKSFAIRLQNILCSGLGLSS